MEGSTAIASERGDELARALMRAHDAIVRRSVAAHHGREVKAMGDGFLVSFLESRVALACALDLRRALAEHNALHPSEPILVRMGLHCGAVIDEHGDLFGLTVNAAAHITAKAASGQILTSEAVRAEAESEEVVFLDRGLFGLKGIAEQWPLYEARRHDEGVPVRDEHRHFAFSATANSPGSRRT